MRILVVGGGGREHALAWVLSQSPHTEKVYVAPGNAGTAAEARCENAPVSASDIGALLKFAQERHIDLTVVGPETPLVGGIVDNFQAVGLACFGPHRAAARLEGSKAYTKRFCARHGIPAAAYRACDDIEAARTFARRHGAPLVIKADGLAAGKGVVIAESVDDAERTIEDMLSGAAFGDAGRRIVIEDFLEGEEASYIVLACGTEFVAMASSQDHKRIGEGDKGLNTGGMGAYSPASLVTPELAARIEHEIIRPTLAGLAADGIPYTGFLYAGIMIGTDGAPQLLEFNCRLGDPETQPILLRFEGDFVELLLSALDGRVGQARIGWKRESAVGVVLAAAGYPGLSRQGDPIYGLAEAQSQNVKIFHAGTAERNGKVITAGGRVLCVTALGEDVAKARERAYRAVSQIRFEGMQYRRDIGHHAVAPAKSTRENEGSP